MARAARSRRSWCLARSLVAAASSSTRRWRTLARTSWALLARSRDASRAMRAWSSWAVAVSRDTRRALRADSSTEGLGFAWKDVRCSVASPRASLATRTWSSASVAALTSRATSASAASSAARCRESCWPNSARLASAWRTSARAVFTPSAHSAFCALACSASKRVRSRVVDRVVSALSAVSRSAWSSKRLRDSPLPVRTTPSVNTSPARVTMVTPRAMAPLVAQTFVSAARSPAM